MSGDSKELWGQNLLICITGASRGFGRAIVKTIAEHLIGVRKMEPDSLTFLLTARSSSLLSEVEKDLLTTYGIKNVELISGPIDGSETLQNLHHAMEKLRDGRDFDHVMMIHNAATIGDPSKRTSQFTIENMKELDEYARINMSSMIILTSSFIKIFKRISRVNIINISSLAAFQAFEGLSLYGAYKAARDNFLKSVAHENAAIKVLNYAPGPLRTDMLETVRSQGYLAELFKDGSILTPEQSAKKMVLLLERNTYENGAHVDYFELE